MPELLDSVPTSIGNYPGTLNHFRAAIARIQRIYWAGYEANDGMLFYFGRQDDDGPACSVWQIRASNGFGIDDHAELVATENPDGTCTVDLHDNSEAFASSLEQPTYGLDRFWEWLWDQIDATEPQTEHADSGHYLFPPKERRQLVEDYRRDRAAGRVRTKTAWADMHGISVRTLSNWEKAFPPDT